MQYNNHENKNRKSITHKSRRRPATYTSAQVGCISNNQIIELKERRLANHHFFLVCLNHIQKANSHSRNSLTVSTVEEFVSSTVCSVENPNTDTDCLIVSFTSCSVGLFSLGKDFKWKILCC